MDWLELLKTLGVTVPVVGGGIAWIWREIKGRFTAMEGKFDARVAGLEDEVRACHADRTALLAAAEMLYVELKRVAPRSAALGRARQLLDLAGKSLEAE
jgi:hypothetical protein